MPKRVKTIKETEAGRNEKFFDNFSGETLTRTKFVEEIKKGNYQNYHTRVINGVETPVSNPDSTKNNNLD